jgi:Ni/Co efflux regulator RcnB
MRRLLISAAAMALLATPALISSAWAQPDDSHRGGRDNAAPQAQQGQPPQGGGHDRGGDRAAQAPETAPPATGHYGYGHRPGPQMAAPAPQAAPQGDRGMAHTNTLPPGWTPQAGRPAQMAPQDRGNRDRNNWQAGQNTGRDFNRSDNRPNNYQGNNFGYRDNRPDNHRDNNFGPNRGNPGYAGQRHDFSNFRDFHRSFNASRHFQAPYYRRPAGWYEHRWSFGEFLPSAFWARDYWLLDFAAYGLPPPPYGAVWVRVGNDALLVDEDSGEVITVEYGVFY